MVTQFVLGAGQCPVRCATVNPSGCLSGVLTSQVVFLRIADQLYCVLAMFLVDLAGQLPGRLHAGLGYHHRSRPGLLPH